MVPQLSKTILVIRMTMRGAGVSPQNRVLPTKKFKQAIFVLLPLTHLGIHMPIFNKKYLRTRAVECLKQKFQLILL